MATNKKHFFVHNQNIFNQITETESQSCIQFQSLFDDILMHPLNKLPKFLKENSSYNKHAVNNNCINKVFLKIQNCNDIYSKKIEDFCIHEKINSLHNCILNYKKNAPQELLICNILNLNDLCKTLAKAFNDNELKIYNREEMINCISQIIKIINQINNIILMMISFKKKIERLFTKLIVGIKELRKKQQESDLKSFAIENVLVDPNLNFIFVLKEQNDKEKDIDFYNKYVDLIKDQFSFLFEKKNYSTTKKKFIYIDDYFKQEVLSTINKINSMSVSDFEIPVQIETKTRFNFDLSKIENIWSNILFITNNHFPLKSDFIYDMFYSISNFYSEYVGLLNINKSFEEFIEIYEADNNLQISHISNKEKCVQVFDQIKQQGKYYYFNVLFQIILKNLLDQKQFNSKLLDDNYETKQYNIIDMFEFNDMNSLFQLYFDNSMNFHLIKKFNQWVKSVEINREKNIFSKSYSKFIVQIDPKNENCYENRIILPFFPIGTLEKMILNRYNNLNSTGNMIDLTYVDKIIIILEIATALYDLHSNNEYHGNISDEIVYINSKLDAYIGSICFDNSNEKILTKLKSCIYFRSPEFFEINKEKADDNNDDYIRKRKLSDIYSFSVLMYVIITDTPIECRMKNKTRYERFDILKNGIKDFLFSGENNECFENDFIDLNGNSLIGMKEIIEKGLNNNSNERYSSIKEIMDLIKLLPIYEKNKEEIEYRLSKSVNIREYKCTIANIVESFIRGKNKSIIYINKLINLCNDFPQNGNSFTSTNDIIKDLFIGFDIRYCKNQNYEHFFEDNLNFLINSLINNRINLNNYFDFNDKLFVLSNDENIKCLSESKLKNESLLNPNIDFIIPISSLGNFIKHNKDKIGNLLPTWIYIISKELSIIHSKNLYHGKLSMNNIGIYYNHETQTFIPSIILFYSLYKRIQYHEQQKQCFYQNLEYSRESIIEKYQKKDIKALSKILYQFDRIPNNIISTVENSKSTNEIVFKLYNIIINESNKEQKLIFNQNYSKVCESSYQITYSVLKHIFVSTRNNLSFEGSFIRIDEILHTIDKFLENLIRNPEKTIKDNMPIISKESSQTQIQNPINSDLHINKIKELFSVINSKCSFLYLNIINQKQANSSQEKCKSSTNQINVIKKKNDRQYKFCNLLEYKITVRQQKLDAMSKRDVFRYVEFSRLYKKSFIFLLYRYIFNLNPKLRYRITIKICNQLYLKTTDLPITLSDVKYVINKINPNWKEPESQDSYIIAYVNIFSI